MSFLENNNRSKILNLRLNQALRLYLLTETRIYSQNPEIKAPKGLQRLVSTKVKQEGYANKNKITVLQCLECLLHRPFRKKTLKGECDFSC